MQSSAAELSDSVGLVPGINDARVARVRPGSDPGLYQPSQPTAEVDLGLTSGLTGRTSGPRQHRFEIRGRDPPASRRLDSLLSPEPVRQVRPVRASPTGLGQPDGSTASNGREQMNPTPGGHAQRAAWAALGEPTIIAPATFAPNARSDRQRAEGHNTTSRRTQGERQDTGRQSAAGVRDRGTR